ncbi:MAG: DUF3108 domain-containing protein, partial [Bacteroidia bacterium]|nr:DUF3108 domain-containing protein [Bacteroidia bacterium]
MNRKFLQNIISCVLLLCSLFSYGQGGESDLSLRVFGDQEEIVYRVYYNWRFFWIPAGEVRFNVNEKDIYFEFVVEGRSYPSYDSFFKVRDDYVSRAEKESLLPINFRRHIEEGRYFVYDSLSFEQEGLIQEYFGKTKQTAKLFEFEISKPVFDMVSA